MYVLKYLERDSFVESDRVLSIMVELSVNVIRPQRSGAKGMRSPYHEARSSSSRL